MSYNKQNYSEEKKKKKGLLLILLVCVLLLFISIAAAFFTSVLFKKGNMSTGTLNLNGSYTFYLNGVETEIVDINNLYPGDVVVVKGNVANIGTQSAWIRDEINLTAPDMLQHLRVYDGEFTQAQLRSQTDFSEFEVAVSVDGSAVFDTKVIDGTNSVARDETSGDYNFLDDSQYEITFTIYFNHLAGNDAQGKTVSFAVGAKALQFVNNDSAVPDDSAWAAIEFVSP